MSEQLRERREAREKVRVVEAMIGTAAPKTTLDLLSDHWIHIQALLFAGATVYVGMRYSWGYTELPKLDAKQLLQEPVPALLSLAHSVGNSDCFDEEYTYSRCCDLTIGPVGDRKCWRGDAGFGYGDCCDAADKVIKAQYLMAAGEKYFQSARWLVNGKARRRHFKDALTAFKLAKQFDELGEELQWMIQNTEGAMRQNDAPPPPPPPRMDNAQGKANAKTLEELPTRPSHEVLGVAVDASPEEIKAAYRKLSRKLHPDRHGGDPAMEQKFMEVTRAHEQMTQEDGFSGQNDDM